MGSKLSDKMHLKGDISKKQQIFGLGLGFFDTHKVIFWEKKISDLIKWFWSKKISPKQVSSGNRAK